ncbi:MAG: hypothetical protein ACI8TQ_003080 [Planctomycetota bacterium]|jgi:hypothetical protein
MKNYSLLIAPLIFSGALSCLSKNAPFEASDSQESDWEELAGCSLGSGATGKFGVEFAASTGEWEVVRDSSAPNDEQVFAQVAQNEKSVFNVTFADNLNAKDGCISVHLRAVSGVIDQGGGVVWRAYDENNYYVARFNPLEDNYRVYYIKDGERVTLASATVSLEPTAWHSLRVVMRGEHIECYLNGTKYLDVHDSTFQEPGKVGLWTKADAQTNFARFNLIETFGL